jgi:hypothetical protein
MGSESEVEYLSDQTFEELVNSLPPQPERGMYFSSTSFH